MTPPKHRTSTAGSPGCPNTPKTQANDLKYNLIKLIDSVKVEMNKFLKGIQENTVKYMEVFKDETNQSLKGIQENIIKQVK